MCIYFINSHCNYDYCNDTYEKCFSLVPQIYEYYNIENNFKNHWTCNFTRAIFNPFMVVYSLMHRGLS